MPSAVYRGRLAPSPTGYLHLGHARTFRTAYERARAAGGTLVLRNEDLDRERCRSEYVQAMYADLRWLGIDWQEGPDIGGPYAPYDQTDRYQQYLEAWRQLVDAGQIYSCTCSRKDLAQAASAPHDDSDEPLYPGTCRPAAGYGLRTRSYNSTNWRFRVPDGEELRFLDINSGEQRFTAGRDFGDFLVWRKDATPSYQLAVTVDDAAMAITEVVRGADLLKSTARQMLLQRALKLPTPAYFHCELMRDQAGVRLAKRHDALSLRHLRGQGLSPEQVLAML
jgi:glutamyl/glutaminyl-tRNA synthetase